MTDKLLNLMFELENQCFVDTSEELSYPPVALSLGEKLLKSKQGDQLVPIPVGTYGNISVVHSLPKTKKTFFISLLASVYLSGKNNFGGDLKGHRNGRCLLHIDTEQGNWHCQRTFKRCLQMNKDVEQGCYHTYALRTLSPKTRIQFIEHLLHFKSNIGVLLLDVIADLCNDVNNIEESNMVTQKLMEWSANYNVHICCVIHSNYGSDKMTGHLGSSLMKKVETEIQLEKNTVNKDWVTVKCKRSRGFAFDTFSFQVNELGLPEVVDNYYDPLKG